MYLARAPALFPTMIDMLHAGGTRTRTSLLRGQPAGAPFDGPLGSYLDLVVRFEDRLTRMLAPLARWTDAPMTTQPDRSV